MAGGIGTPSRRKKKRNRKTPGSNKPKAKRSRADQTKPKKYKAPQSNASRRLFDDAAGETAESPTGASGLSVDNLGFVVFCGGLLVFVVYFRPTAKEACRTVLRFVLSVVEITRQALQRRGITSRAAAWEIFTGGVKYRWGLVWEWILALVREEIKNDGPDAGGNAQAPQPMDVGVPEEKHGG